jgi:hypothetical protein
VVIVTQLLVKSSSTCRKQGVQKGPPLDSVPSQPDPVHTLILYCFDLHFSIILVFSFQPSRFSGNKCCMQLLYFHLSHHFYVIASGSKQHLSNEAAVKVDHF